MKEDEYILVIEYYLKDKKTVDNHWIISKYWSNHKH